MNVKSCGTPANANDGPPLFWIEMFLLPHHKYSDPQLGDGNSNTLPTNLLQTHLHITSRYQVHITYIHNNSSNTKTTTFLQLKVNMCCVTSGMLVLFYRYCLKNKQNSTSLHPSPRFTYKAHGNNSQSSKDS